MDLYQISHSYFKNVDDGCYTEQRAESAMNGYMGQYSSFSRDSAAHSELPSVTYGSEPQTWPYSNNHGQMIDHNWLPVTEYNINQQVVFPCGDNLNYGGTGSSTAFHYNALQVMHTNAGSNLMTVTPVSDHFQPVAQQYPTQNYFQHDVSKQQAQDHQPLATPSLPLINNQPQYQHEQSTIHPLTPTEPSHLMDLDEYRDQIKIQILEPAPESVSVSSTATEPGPSPTQMLSSQTLRKSKERSTNTTNEHECSFCEKTFKSKQGCSQHEKAKHRELNHKCTQCGKKFVSEERLTIHMHRHINPDKPFKCQEPGCEKTYIHKNDFRRHKYSHDPSTMPFECDTCGKRFYREDQFRTHKIVHIRREQERMKRNVGNEEE